MKILEFSGGKDSLAVLLLLRDHLPEITVLWADSGNSFPETIAQMEKVRAICPNFIIAHGNQPEVIERGGYPVDVLPMRNHSYISRMAQQNRLKLQGFFECCTNSFLLPMHQKALELGATTIIRGQKACDSHKSPLKNGDVVDGIQYLFPIEDWTDDQVMEFVKDSPLLPTHYSEANTGLDCMHCTAYLADNQWKLNYLKRNYPETAKEVTRRLTLIQQEIRSDMQHIDALIGEKHGT